MRTLARRSRVIALLASAALSLGTLIIPVAPASASTTSYVWYLTKNYSDQTNSTISLIQNFSPYSVLQNYRGGSGIAGHQDECEVNYGWIPNGYGSVTGYSYNWPGTSVVGPVLILADKQCYNGTWRTELFVHSSYAWNSGHYQSNGCVKASNTGGPSGASGDIRSIVDAHVWYGEPYALGAG